ncbi:17-beta-hydroxysteroid dehydrogenase type 6 [Caerostris extrusa]|uniref:17-beta-hydroxysteroid dehydrogenase type 6 n=1 Tax=Caerostris extrusa TaxID=172846 RepID=A0AAV4NSZ4_CAEEX|nr:17-beta-hydroxysteroid dehydrogenase type 6 [Caerostris extrusa]
MTNRENMIKCIDFTCKDVGDGIKYEYGELYMERVKTMIAEIFAMSPSNTHLVTDAIEAAVSMQHPCSVYRPTGSKIRHFLRFCSEYLPSHFVDVGLKIIQILFRVPTPKAARKS